MHAHLPRQSIISGIQISTSMVIDHAFRVTGRTRRIIQRDSIPLIGRVQRGEPGVTFRQKRFIIHGTNQFSALVKRVINIDHQHLTIQLRQGSGNYVAELTIRKQHLRFSMIKNKGNSRRIEPGVDGVQNRPGHGYREMELQHLWNVRQHGRHGVAPGQASFG